MSDDQPIPAETPKVPTTLNVSEGTPHKVEKMGDGRFMAYWNRRAEACP